jgi:hypothetical protein
LLHIWKVNFGRWQNSFAAQKVNSSISLNVIILIGQWERSALLRCLSYQ